MLHASALALCAGGAALLATLGLDRILTEELGNRVAESAGLARTALAAELQGLRALAGATLEEARSRRLDPEDTRALLTQRLGQDRRVLSLRVRPAGQDPWTWARARLGGRLSLLDVRYPMELGEGESASARFALIDEGRPALRLAFATGGDFSPRSTWVLDLDPLQLEGARRAGASPVLLVLLDAQGRAVAQWPKARFVPGESVAHLEGAALRGLVTERPDGPPDLAHSAELGIAGLRLLALAPYRAVSAAARPWSSALFGWVLLFGALSTLAFGHAGRRLLSARARLLRRSLARALERPAPGLLAGAEPMDEISALALDAQRAIDRVRHRQRRWSSLAKFGMEEPPRLPEDTWVKAVCAHVTVDGLGESLDPANPGSRETAEQWNDLLQTVRQAVEERGGVLDQVMGTSLTAFFGLGPAAEDPAEQAWGALALIQERLERLNLKRREAGQPQLRLNAGVHRGQAYASTLGAEGRQEYTLLGEAPRVAHALAELAREERTGILFSAPAWPSARLGPQDLPPGGRPTTLGRHWSGTVHVGPSARSQGPVRALPAAGTPAAGTPTPAPGRKSA
ncbi:MAG: adenylate/guanylate cyclase domain-containing protein [Bdellovibrionales bacterium]|nr:adenylate/guanylate cyclase domain-containing protein [Bdellovibrionales bacterium]